MYSEVKMRYLFERPEAIVYSSNAGHTSEYAEIIGCETGLPVYPISKGCAAGTKVLYMGWLMAGTVNGYKKAAKRYKICAVCGVGMSENGSQIEDIKKANNLSGDTPIFSLQGGFDMSLLHGIYKFMMKTVAAGAMKKLKGKENLTEEEAKSLEMITKGANYVSVENAREIIDIINQKN